MTKLEFIKQLNEMGLEQYQIELIFKYKDFLQQQNKITNLTRLDREDIIYSDYFLESIWPFWKMQFNPVQDQRLLDIGSGSGIPGVLLKIFYPQLKITLIESNAKKVNFLNQLINLLDLKNIDVICGRSEEIIREQNLYESFDYVTSRAVSSLHNILELSAGYCKVNGLIIQPKSTKYVEELNNAKQTINNLDLVNKEIIEYDFNNKFNALLIFSKNSITNRKYPRTWAQILKDENISSNKPTKH